MNLTRDRIQSIGWAFVLTVCIALTVALTLRVNAVKGQVHEAEGKIVSVKQDIQFLEIEFQSRANQQQLAALNDVEFGYIAPGAGQYIEGERQLAALGMPRGPGAPRPIRMASAVTETEAMPFTQMVSPVTGERAGPAPAASETAKADSPAKDQAKTQAVASNDVIGAAIAGSTVRAKLARAELGGGADE